MNFVEIDKLNYTIRRVHWKAEKAKRVIHAACYGQTKIGLSFSGGKDSTAAAIIALEAGLKPELVWFNSGYEFPETKDYVRNFAQKHTLSLREIKPEIDPLQAKLEAGYFDLPAIEKVNRKILSPWWSTNKEYDVVITGLRCQESRARRMTIGKNGQWFYNKSFGAIACYPVSYFDANEIFALLANRNQEFHPIYGKATDMDEREWIRVNWYILSINERGFYLFLKRHYPQQFALLEKCLPEIRSSI